MHPNQQLKEKYSVDKIQMFASAEDVNTATK
jgi:hypothetical protein